MRVLAIGDIHGCYNALATLEGFVAFDASDLIITVGDYVDRGSHSRAVLDWLIARRLQFRLIPLLGNHELMMLAADRSDRHFEEWIACGGDATLRSYGTQAAPESLRAIPKEHWRFIKSCRAYYETDTHFFVHANACPDVPLSEQPDYMLYWEQFRDPAPHNSGKVMVCGHTPHRDGLPRSIGHAVCIDTCAHDRGWLTCLDVLSGRYWQANELRETRSSALPPLA